MNLFLFTNFFPYEKSEPFLANEFEFTQKKCSSISILALYGKEINYKWETPKDLLFCGSVLDSTERKSNLFFRGVFNIAPFHHHFKEFFFEKIFLSPKKTYWHLVSLLITRTVLSSKPYKRLLHEMYKVDKAILYFYWGDNLCWVVPYIQEKLKNQNIKVVIRLHGSDLYENLKGDYAPLRKKIFSRANLITTVSDYGKSYLGVKYDLTQDKLKTSRLGVFDNGLNSLSGVDTKIIVSVSNIVGIKRVHLVFEILQKCNSRIIWHHFGDGPLMEELRELIKTKRAGLDVVLHGYVSNSEIISFYKTTSINLFMNVSSTEGLPVSIMEALSFGIPVLATNVGGVGEIINEQVGELIEVNFDVNKVSSKVEKLLNSPKEVKMNLRINSRNAFERLVSAETNYNNFYELLESL